MDEQQWTMGRLLSWTADYLRERGADSPRLDAEVLLAHARGCRRIELYTAYEEPADEGLRSRFRELVKQRASGMPVAYLVGQREFFSLAFEVTTDVLIPRPETEDLVVRGLDLLRQNALGLNGDPPLIADVGTGSGVLAIALARHLPTARATAVDVSSAALDVARRNAARHGVADRIEFVCGDLFDQVEAGRKFHLIVSNPPYVAASEWNDLPDDVRKYEPRLALDGGPDGVAIIERLALAAPQRLFPQGRLLMEIGPAIAERVERLLADQAQFAHVSLRRDLGGLPRVAEAVFGG